MSSINERFKPVIGKNVIENLTIGMYDVPFFVYREYIQNAADQIDKAKKQKLCPTDNLGVKISIDKKTRTIIIEDNATGIEQSKVLPMLGNIAQSTKQKGIDKGFRGIGRLGGLGYCNKLTFETSYYGESVKSTMVWDAKKLKELLNNSEITADAAEIISIITDYSFDYNENADTHYFKVIMENVTNEELLDVKKVKDYLSVAGPIPFVCDNLHDGDAIKIVNENTVSILLNGEKLYRNYDTLCKDEENKIIEIKKTLENSKTIIEQVLTNNKANNNAELLQQAINNLTKFLKSIE